MTAKLKSYMRVNRGGGLSGCGRDVIELNPWHTYTFQNCSECNPLLQEGICDITAEEIAECLCCDFRPNLPLGSPSDPRHPNQGGGFAAWWYDPTLPDISGGAFGPVFHSFELQDPKDFTAARDEKIRDVIQLGEGRVLAEAIVELAGLDQKATRWLFGLLKRELESVSTCCASTVDVYVDCGDTDGLSGLRRLTGAAEFLVTEVQDRATFGSKSTMVSILFSADALLEHEGAAAPGTITSLGVTDPVNLPPTTETVQRPSFGVKDICLADLQLQSDGQFKVCPVNYTTYDPATCFLKWRGLKVEDTTTIVPSPIQIDLDVTEIIPRVTPLQPDLWQEHVYDVIIGGGSLDCVRYPIVVRNVTAPNPDYRPECDNCPPDVRARIAAQNAGLVVDMNGLIDWAASGINPSTAYSVDSGDTPSVAMQKILDFLLEIGWRGSDEGIEDQPIGNFEAVIASAQDYATETSLPVTPIGYTIILDPFGAPTNPEVHVYSAASDPFQINTDFKAVLDPFPGLTSAYPIIAEGDEGLCGEVADNCLPTITGPVRGGGPIVNLTIAEASPFPVLQILSDINLATNDLFDAEFVFGPCPTITDPGCVAAIPTSAPMTIVGDVATPVGWVPGFGWPSSSVVDQYPIVSIDGDANSEDPVQTLVPRVQLIQEDEDCEAPCGSVSVIQPEVIAGDCWVDVTNQQRAQLGTATLSPSFEYRPRWSIETASPLDRPQVFLWTGPAGSPAPTAATLDDFISGHSAARVKRLDGGMKLSHSSEGLRVQCGEKPLDALSGGWVDATDVWEDPRVCEAGVAYLLVMSDIGSAAPTVEFDMVPIGTP